jgi:S-DNA-T family DNA segregation ATPase FtsK/SpoIIIE
MTDSIPMTEEQAVVVVLQHKMTTLGLCAKHVESVAGPIVSVHKFLPLGATRVSQIEGLAQDFAVALSVEDVFVKRMPGEAAVGIFVPNRERKSVLWRDMCSTTNDTPVPLVLGIDVNGRRIVEDLTTLPHLLIAGSTGSGKSTLLGSLIASILVNRKDVYFVLSDTKGVEFNHFSSAKQLYCPISTTVEGTVLRFDMLVEEMERRLRLYANNGHRNILEHNQAYEGTARRLPYIVVVIDELYDLLTDGRKVQENDEERSTTLGKDASGKLAKLAQKARATGIHIIASTQRPSVKLLEGDIKANFPARITFRLPSEADSRTVLGTGGAEHLLSRGDMLFVNPNRPGLQRIHAPLASIVDIEAAVKYASR